MLLTLCLMHATWSKKHHWDGVVAGCRLAWHLLGHWWTGTFLFFVLWTTGCWEYVLLAVLYLDGIVLSMVANMRRQLLCMPNDVTTLPANVFLVRMLLDESKTGRPASIVTRMRLHLQATQTAIAAAVENMGFVLLVYARTWKDFLQGDAIVFFLGFITVAIYAILLGQIGVMKSQHLDALAKKQGSTSKESADAIDWCCPPGWMNTEDMEAPPIVVVASSSSSSTKPPPLPPQQQSDSPRPTDSLSPPSSVAAMDKNGQRDSTAAAATAAQLPPPPGLSSIAVSIPGIATPDATQPSSGSLRTHVTRIHVHPTDRGRVRFTGLTPIPR